MKSEKRNITLLTIALPLYEAWFWLGIWLLFYLRITNFTGIGVIESAMIIAGFLFEIPTGAFADMFGRKVSLLFAFGLSVLGNIVMAFATTFPVLLISVLILSISFSFKSGTSDALLYDSLASAGKEKTFDDLLSRIQTITLIVMALSSFAGGFLYSVNPALPFLFTALASLGGFLLCLFLAEVKDTSETEENYSIFTRVRKGFFHLFENKKGWYLLASLFILASFAKVLIEMLDPALALDFGYTDYSLGILYAIVALVTAVGTHFYPTIKRLLPIRILVPVLILSFLGITALSPIAGMIIGTTTLMYRNIFYRVIDIISADSINKFVETKYRATALSSFTMLISIPYIFVALLVGYSIDQQSASLVALWMSGIGLGVWGCVQGLRRVMRDKV